MNREDIKIEGDTITLEEGQGETISKLVESAMTPLTTKLLKENGWVYSPTPTGMKSVKKENMWWSYGVWTHKDSCVVLRGDNTLKEPLKIDGYLNSRVETAFDLIFLNNIFGDK